MFYMQDKLREFVQASVRDALVKGAIEDALPPMLVGCLLDDSQADENPKSADAVEALNGVRAILGPYTDTPRERRSLSFDERLQLGDRLLALHDALSAQ